MNDTPPLSSSDWNDPPPRGISWRILVADDNPLTVKLLVYLLEARGHQMETAENGREVLESLTQDHFDLVLMDVEMPELTGLETTRTIRAVEEEDEKLFLAFAQEIQDDWTEFPERLPILALTAHSSEKHIQECLDAGMDAYLRKPVQATDLYAAVEDLMTWSILENRVRRRLIQERELERITRKVHDPSLLPPPHILVVEDNRVNQTLVQRILEKEGYRVTIAGNGQAGVTAFQEEFVDAIVMDIQMPIMDGLQATSVIRTLEHDRYTPIIALTSAYKEVSLEECERVGMTRCLKKPVQPKELLALLRDFCPVQSTPLAGPHSSLIAPAETETYFDAEEVAVQMGYEPELLADLVTLLLEDLPHQIGELDNGLKTDNRSTVLSLTHNLRGAISPFTTGKPFELIGQIHDLADDSQLEEAREVFTTLTLALKQLVAELQAFTRKVNAI